MTRGPSFAAILASRKPGKGSQSCVESSSQCDASSIQVAVMCRGIPVVEWLSLKTLALRLVQCIPLKCLFGVILPIFLLVQPAFNFTSSKTGFCPLRLSVTSCAPRCMSDWECGEDRKCCPNICGSMSCAATSAVESSDKKFDSSNSGANARIALSARPPRHSVPRRLKQLFHTRGIAQYHKKWKALQHIKNDRHPSKVRSFPRKINRDTTAQKESGCPKTN
ncbi:unnamed protein product [Bemisia tabaci]|uniref:WAP domain-containing protein n=1 Tax=Bemisia tabaci TaxID=7038 RepID=A0A9P0A2R3_BEMTA|nr:unnamed protein product [Bemisia tabaci]